VAVQVAPASRHIERRTARATPIKKYVLLVVSVAALTVVGLVVGNYLLETLFTDAATRLAYDIRDQTIILRLSKQTTRVFAHRPRRWPEGLSGAYRIEITEDRTIPWPGHRSIGVARNLTEPTWYFTSYHLNFVQVPKDLVVSHQKDEPTVVTLTVQDGKVLLTDLK
jgi:hypothetical protein